MARFPKKLSIYLSISSISGLNLVKCWFWNVEVILIQDLSAHFPKMRLYQHSHFQPVPLFSSIFETKPREDDGVEVARWLRTKNRLVTRVTHMWNPILFIKRCLVTLFYIRYLHRFATVIILEFVQLASFRVQLSV